MRQGAARSGQRADRLERRGASERSGAERGGQARTAALGGAELRGAETARTKSEEGGRQRQAEYLGAEGSCGARHYEERGAAAAGSTAPEPRTAPRWDAWQRLAGRAAAPGLQARERGRGAGTARERPATPA